MILDGVKKQPTNQKKKKITKKQHTYLQLKRYIIFKLKKNLKKYIGTGIVIVPLGLQNIMFLQRKLGFNWLKYEHLENMLLEKN